MSAEHRFVRAFSHPSGRWLNVLEYSRLSEPHQSAELRILVTIPASYPSTSPPQLQLLSRYVGDYSVDASIFGTVLRTYLARPGVEWNPGDVAIL